MSFMHASIFYRPVRAADGDYAFLHEVDLPTVDGPATPPRGLDAAAVPRLSPSDPSPPPAAAAVPSPEDDEIDEETGAVRFYDASKGFGMISSHETGEDVFVHSSVLREAGRTDLPQGAVVRFRAEDAEPRPRVIEIVSVDASSAVVPAAPVAEATAEGVVTAWLEDKGYGFVLLDDGRSVFVHRSAIGGGALVPRTRRSVSYRHGDKGPVAVSVS